MAIRCSHILKPIFLFLLSMLLLLSWGACGSPSAKIENIEGDTIEMRHSSLLTIVECEGYTVADVKNPWNGNLLKRYLLLPRNSGIPDGLPRGVLLRVPLERAVVFSGVHASLLAELGVAGVIGGVCDARYMYCDAVRERLSVGEIADCGSSLNVNSERIMQVAPDAIFVLPYENGGYGKLENMKYPLVECADYMENSPLGCAEWVRFYGRLVGMAAKSDSLFNAVCNEYEELAARVKECGHRPELLCELKSSSAWYVPGGASTVGRLYSDAGADYIFSDYKVNGSVPLSYETVLDKAADADIWLIKYNRATDISMETMLADFQGYSHFKPFKEGMVYGCNTHNRNIFEETSFHPERLLKELVALFHPALLPEYKAIYYEKIR